MRSFLNIFFLFFIVGICLSCKSQKKIVGQCVIKNNMPIKAQIIFIGPTNNDTINTDKKGFFSFEKKDNNHKIFYAYINNDSISRVVNIDSVLSSNKNIVLQVPDDNFYAHYRKDKICPICKNGKSLVPIIYGMPRKEDFEMQKRGEVVLAGCVIMSDNPPQFHCKKHNFDF